MVWVPLDLPLHLLGHLHQGPGKQQVLLAPLLALVGLDDGIGLA